MSKPATSPDKLDTATPFLRLRVWKRRKNRQAAPDPSEPSKAAVHDARPAKTLDSCCTSSTRQTSGFPNICFRTPVFCRCDCLIELQSMRSLAAFTTMLLSICCLVYDDILQPGVCGQRRQPPQDRSKEPWPSRTANSTRSRSTS